LARGGINPVTPLVSFHWLKTLGGNKDDRENRDGERNHSLLTLLAPVLSSLENAIITKFEAPKSVLTQPLVGESVSP
jgi:hypothetical protein